MKETLKMINKKEKEFIIGKMERDMKEIGGMVLWKEKELIFI